MPRSGWRYRYSKSIHPLSLPRCIDCCTFGQSSGQMRADHLRGISESDAARPKMRKSSGERDCAPEAGSHSHVPIPPANAARRKCSMSSSLLGSASDLPEDVKPGVAAAVAAVAKTCEDDPVR